MSSITPQTLVDAVNLIRKMPTYCSIYPIIEYSDKKYIEYLKKSWTIDNDWYNKDKSVQYKVMPLLRQL